MPGKLFLRVNWCSKFKRDDPPKIFLNEGLKMANNGTIDSQTTPMFTGLLLY